MIPGSTIAELGIFMLTPDSTRNVESEIITENTMHRYLLFAKHAMFNRFTHGLIIKGKHSKFKLFYWYSAWTEILFKGSTSTATSQMPINATLIFSIHHITQQSCGSTEIPSSLQMSLSQLTQY